MIEETRNTTSWKTPPPQYQKPKMTNVIILFRGRTGSLNNNTYTFPYFQVSYRGHRGDEICKNKTTKKQPKHPQIWDKYFSQALKRLARSVSFAICIGRTILNFIL
jgi:hypothetical protein